MLYIGGLQLTKPHILSPLAGVSSFPFRMINRKFGCELAFTEMICARSLASANRKTMEALHTAPEDSPLGIQLVGEDAAYILKAMEKLQKIKLDVLELNAACPTRKVVNNGRGAALIRSPEKLRDILKTMVKESPWPVTVKIRTGWENSDRVKEIALYARDAGIAAIFIHGRTKAQGYRGETDYKAIKAAKEAVDIPVIGSGNVFSGPMAKKMLDLTGCDAVAVARGALGNPWIFDEIETHLSEGSVPMRPPAEKVAEVMKEHFRLTLDFYGEKRAVKIFRKFAIWYTKGFRNIRPLRARAAKVKAASEMTDFIDEFLSTHSQAVGIDREIRRESSQGAIIQN